MTHSCGWEKKRYLKSMEEKTLRGFLNWFGYFVIYVKFHHKNPKAYKNILKSKLLIVGDLEFYQILPHFPHVLFTTGI